VEDYKQRAFKEAERAIDKVCEEQLEGCPLYVKRIVFGNPTMEILRTIESEDIDLVIMGRHGHSGIGHCVMGSVAENVVKEAPVPVLIINPDKVKLQTKMRVMPKGGYRSANSTQQKPAH
jgi:nucleotide-binding universal stress UspA family protein